jgi:hypothetical protein
MSCLGHRTMNECGEAKYPFSATSLEPLKWNRMVLTYITIGGEDLVSEACYYMRAGGVETLQFRHEYTYDAGGNLIQLDVY